MSRSMCAVANPTTICSVKTPICSTRTMMIQWRQQQEDDPRCHGPNQKIEYSFDDRISVSRRIRRNASLISQSLVESEGFIEEKHEPFDRQKDGITKFEAAVQLIKTLVGMGILFMPYALSRTGLILGVLLIALTALITSVVFRQLLRVAEELSIKHGVESYSISETMKKAMEFRPALHKFGNMASKLTSFLIIVTCYSVVMVYTLIISGNLQQIVLYFGGRELSIRTYVAILLPLLIVANSFKKLKHLTPITIIALTCIWTGIIMTIYFLIEHFSLDEFDSNPPRYEMWNSLSGLPKFFSIVVFAFNAIPSVLPVFNHMKEPKALVEGCVPLMSFVLWFVAAVYALYGILGYLAFGAIVKGPITDSIGLLGFAQISLKMLLSFGLYLSSPILLYAPLAIVSGYVESLVRRESKDLVSILTRWSQIVLIVCVPLIVTDIIALLGLLGSFFLLLQYVFPPVLDTIVFVWEETGARFWFKITQNVLLISFGTVLMVSVFVSGVIDLIG